MQNAFGHTRRLVPSEAGREAWRAEFVALSALALPLVGTQIGQIAMMTTDVLMMGWIGPEALAAGSLAASLHNTLWLFCLGVLVSTAALIAQARGAKDFRGVRRTVRQGLWIALLLAIPSCLVLWQTEPILRLLGQDPEASNLAQRYVRAEIWGFAPSLGFVVLRSFAAAMSRPQAPMVVMLLATVLNFPLNYVFMFGHLGFPAMGLVGAGVSTAIVQTLMFAALLGYLLSERRFRRHRILMRFWRPDWPRFKEILRLGVPIGLAILCEASLFSVAAILIGWIGTAQLAAHAIVLQCASVSFMVPLGIGQACTVRVGLAVGRRDRDGVARSGWAAIALGTVVMVFAALLFLLAPRLLTSAFIDLSLPANFETLKYAVLLFAIAAAFQVFDGAQVAAAHALRGMSDTRGPLIIGVIGYWFIGIGSALLLGFQFGLGVAGVWLGLVIGLAFAAFALIWRFVTHLGRSELPALVR